MAKHGTGWQCPGCGVNYAPSVDRCECTKHAPVQRYTYPYWPYYRWYVGDPYPAYYGTGTITISSGTSNATADLSHVYLSGSAVENVTLNSGY